VRYFDCPASGGRSQVKVSHVIYNGLGAVCRRHVSTSWDVNRVAVPERILGLAVDVPDKNAGLNGAITPAIAAGAVNFIGQTLFRIV
jgi:hypothetical protein